MKERKYAFLAKLVIFAAGLWIGFAGGTYSAWAAEAGQMISGKNTRGQENTDPEQAALDIGITQELDRIQEYLDQASGNPGDGGWGISFWDLMKAFAVGNLETVFQTVKEGLRSILFSQVTEGAGLLAQVAAIGLMGALFSGTASVFKEGQISDTGFYVTYLLLFVCLAGSFLASLSITAGVLDRILEFMRVLMPAYFMAVSFSGGSISALCMYEAMMAAVTGVQWLCRNLFLSGVKVYVLLTLGSHVMKEPLLSKLTSLTEQIIEWGIKTMFGLVLGLHVLEAMVLPYGDSATRSGLLKLAEMIPGLGAGAGAAARLVLGSGVLIKNTMGAAAVTVLFFISLVPVVKLLLLMFLYQAAGAIMQPVCDKRMVELVLGVARGHRLLLKLALYSLLLFVIAIAITCGAANVAYLAA